MPTVKELIEILQTEYKPEQIIAYDLWSVEDILSHDDTCSNPEEILEAMQDSKDANYGLNWDTVQTALDFHS